MKRALALTLLTATLGGCATQWPDPRAIEPTRPRIFVTTESLLVVNQDPVIVPKENRTVVWQLPRDGKARFAKDTGITIDTVDKLLLSDGSVMKDASARIAAANSELKRRAGRNMSLVPCRMESDFEYSCTFPTDLPKGLYAYTIRVMIDGRLVELDPRAMP